jgi:transcriptional regulator with GAF, ATPase, and Fis domain
MLCSKLGMPPANHGRAPASQTSYTGAVSGGAKLAAFVEVALDLSASLRAEDRYRRLLAAIRTALPVDGGMLLRREGDMLYPVAISGLQVRALAMAFPASLRAVAGDSDRRAPTRTVGEVGLLAGYEDMPIAEQPPGVLIGLPLQIEGQVVGALNLGAKDPHAFDDVPDEDFAVYGALAAAALRTADLIETIERESELRQRVAQELMRVAAQRVDGPLLGTSALVRALRERVAEAAEHDRPLLIVGPQGSGREATARAVHEASRRSEHAFIFASCALQQTERRGLFATNELGAGAASKLALARGGSLYLDGVDLLDAELQRELAALLADDRGADARIIASLSDPAAEPRLPAALIGAMDRIEIPALRDRREDIAIIAQHYAARFSRRVYGADKKIGEASLSLLRGAEWRGNVAELRNVIERAVVESHGPTVQVSEGLLHERPTLGSYTLIEPLGEGGMGSVWLANHKHLSRPAAVKLINPEALKSYGDPSAMMRRFQREAEATAKLCSQHTVEVYDFGVSDQGAFYYVMERLHGLDLDSMVRDHGPLDPERVVHLLLQACRSLAEAHEAGLIHHDVKPANLFACGRPDYDFLKVLDFGLVTALSRDADDAPVSDVARTMPDPSRFETMFGDTQGTPAFAAPEVIAASGADQRADLYSLGCAAFFLLEGRPPFEAEDLMRLMILHLRAPPPRLTPRPGVSGDLEHIILACLAKDPADRPPNAEALYDALARVRLPRPWDHQRARAWWRQREP